MYLKFFIKSREIYFVLIIYASQCIQSKARDKDKLLGSDLCKFQRQKKKSRESNEFVISRMTANHITPTKH